MQTILREGAIGVFLENAAEIVTVDKLTIMGDFFDFKIVAA